MNAARGSRPRWPALVVVVALLVGAGAYGAVRFFAGADDEAIAYVPKDAFAYVSVFLEPSTSQRRALRDLIERSNLASVAGAESALAELLDGPLTRIGLEFERDLEPWLGGQAAAFAVAPDRSRSQPGWGLLIATDDEDSTRRSLERYRSDAGLQARSISYKDTSAELLDDGTVTGFVGSFLFVGSRDAFEGAIDAGEGESLDDSARYLRALDGLQSDRLAVAYLDTGALVNALSGEAALGFLPPTFLGSLFDQTSAAVIFASPDGLVVDASSGLLERSFLGDVGRFVGKPGDMESALDPSPTLAQRPGWRRAVDSLGAKHVPLLYIDVGAMRAGRLGRGPRLEISDPFVPWIESLTYVISGTRRADGKVWARTVMGVE